MLYITNFSDKKLYILYPQLLKNYINQMFQNTLLD